MPTPQDPTTIQIEVTNTRPTITLVPGTNGHYRIVFSSNAPHPAFFDGVDTDGALAADGNQEIWIYELPIVVDVDLTTGADIPLPGNDLATGTFTRITNTPASRVPSAGAPGIPPFVADDNRDATISETGEIIAFISTRNEPLTTTNADHNPELFLHNISVPGAFVQGTATQDSFVGPILHSVFQSNPSMSADGTVIAFVSNGLLPGNNNNDDGSGHGNAEVYIGAFDGSTFTITKQATRTKDETSGVNLGATVNILSPGRRLSRDGSLVAFESRAADPKANSATNENFHAVFIYNITGGAADTFVKVSPRAAGDRATTFGDVFRLPTFTDYDSALHPATLVFASALNFKPDGTFPATGQGDTGLNNGPGNQLFATAIDTAPGTSFRRLTKNPQTFTSFVSPVVSATRERIVYTVGGYELGGGNADASTEVFYLLSPPVTTESAAVLSFFTGASNIPLPNASPSPSPTPTPSPTPGTTTGLAPGELGIIRTTEEFVASDRNASGSETKRSPALPIELNGVSVSVNGAAAGLYFVGQASKQINFVVPIGVPTGVRTVVVNSRMNGGKQFRGFITIVSAQPDIFTTTNDAGGRAAVVNVTNPMSRTPEPFNVTSTDGNGNTFPTVLEVSLTGARNAVVAEVKVSIVTATATTDITGDQIVLVRPNREMPGWDIIHFKLPASLAGAGDVPIIVTITKSGTAFVSRPAATAPHITIN